MKKKYIPICAMVISLYSFRSESQIFDNSNRFDLITGTPTSIVIKDINGDGKPDIGTADAYSRNVNVFRNIGTSGAIATTSFDTPVPYLDSNNAQKVDFIDLNKDGKPDLISSDFGVGDVNTFTTPAYLAIYKNISESSSTQQLFAAKHFYLPLKGRSSNFVAADFDGDELPDIIGAHVFGVLPDNKHYLTFYRNTSSGGEISFSKVADSLFTNGIPIMMKAADFDGDNKIDVAFALDYSSDFLIYRNVSEGVGDIKFVPMAPISFLQPGTTKTDYKSYSIDLGDIDKDGKTDIVYSSYTNGVISIFRNTSTPGSLVFPKPEEAVVIYPIYVNQREVKLGDMNCDGLLDIVISHDDANKISIFQNKTIGNDIAFVTEAEATMVTTPPISGTPDINAKYIYLADIDGDKSTDLAIADGFNGRVYIYRNLKECTALSVESELSSSNFLIAPNPAKNFLEIKAANLYAQSVHLTIMNNLGQTINAQYLPVNNGEINSMIDLNGFEKGIYYLQISDGRSLKSNKVIIE